jgi:hypothetical protein
MAVNITLGSPCTNGEGIIANNKITAEGSVDGTCTVNAVIAPVAGGIPIQGQPHDQHFGAGGGDWNFTFSNPVSGTQYSLTVFAGNGGAAKKGCTFMASRGKLP